VSQGIEAVSEKRNACRLQQQPMCYVSSTPEIT
jgi:hypothetical protein